MTDTKTREIFALAATDRFALRNAGWTPTDLRNAGWIPTDLKEFDDIPVIENVYSRLFEDIQTNKRKFSQSTFGPETAVAEKNICNTPMRTAGNLVNMAGKIGYALKEKYGWANAARLIHGRAHPGWPPQNYGGIPDAWALAWIETMAEHEKNGTKPVGYVEPLEGQE